MSESGQDVDTKNYKRRKFQNGDVERNIIKNLPDTMLLHILSFLPAKDVLKTSILSKRWRHLWMSVSNLDFEEWIADKRTLFLTSAERAMMWRDVPKIEKFSIACEVLDGACRINALISNALCFKVQDLSLVLDNGSETFMLPHHLFFCPTLTALKLQITDNFQLPSTTCFPNLNELKLSFCIFSDEQSILQFFGGCPKLQKLTLNECEWGDAKFVCISTPMLESVVICDVNWGGGCQVVISGAKVKSFSYSGELKTNYCLYSSSSIIDACIEVRSKSSIERERREREAAYRVHKLIMECCNVKSLVLSPDTIEILAYAEELDLPVFPRLTHLKLKRKCIDLSCRALHKLLQKLPHLECLDFGMGIFLSKKHKNFIWDPMPPCLLTKLKTIKIHTFSATDKELHAVRILFSISTVLEKMYISGGWLNQNEISKLPRKSTCEIIYT